MSLEDQKGEGSEAFNEQSAADQPIKKFTRRVPGKFVPDYKQMSRGSSARFMGGPIGIESSPEYQRAARLGHW